jgi:hypothetical protein
MSQIICLSRPCRRVVRRGTSVSCAARQDHTRIRSMVPGAHPLDLRVVVEASSVECCSFHRCVHHEALRVYRLCFKSSEGRKCYEIYTETKGVNHERTCPARALQCNWPIRLTFVLAGSPVWLRSLRETQSLVSSVWACFVRMLDYFIPVFPPLHQFASTPAITSTLPLSQPAGSEPPATAARA